jgi:hypothetical protein
MLKYNLKDYSKDFDLCEIFQSLNIKFSMVDGEGQQICAPHKCRDFLGDILWSKATDREAHIYGFNYSHAEAPKDESVTRLSMKFPKLEYRKTFIKNIKEFNEKIGKYGAEPCKVFTAGTHTLVVEGDKCWQSAGWKISFYTFYLKVMCYESIEDLEDPEDGYYKKLMKNEKVRELFWKNMHNPFTHFPAGINEQHNHTGFYATMRGQAKELNKEILGGITV